MSSAGQSNRSWRDDLVQAVGRLFSDAREPFGVDHALRVERSVQDILHEPEYRAGSATDEEVLLAAALLHEVGLVHTKHHWSDDGLEHLGEGAGLARGILRNNDAFEGRPDRVERVLGLIAHHDDTVHAFPSRRRGGAPAGAHGPSVPEGIEEELAVLREADGCVHVGAAEIAASIGRWKDQGIPYFAEHGPPLSSWMWHECVVANIRLAVKRAVVDSHTEAGRHHALAAHDRLEGLIREECQQEGVTYEGEISAPPSREHSVALMKSRSFSLRIDAFHGWDSLERELGWCTLRDDRSIYPYKAARLRPEIAEINKLRPLALYVLENRLDEVLELHDALMVQYCFGLWDLPGWMEFRYNSPRRQVIAPPLVEEYVEDKAFSRRRSVAALVDGLHRCMAARRRGLGRIRAIVASGVPYPLVPLPVQWPKVKVVRKRDYRYNSLDEFPDVSGLSDVKITDDNFRYFFYRDLGRLGSLGERTFREFDEIRAGKA